MFNPTQKNSAGSEFEKKLIRYAFMGGAALALPALSYAGPILTPENTTISGNDSLDVTLDGVTAFTLNTYVDTNDSGVTVTGPSTTQFVISKAGGGPFDAYATALGSNALISSSSNFGSATNSTKLSEWKKDWGYSGNWSPNNGEAFLGIQFQVSTNTYYGFALIQTDVTDPAASATLLETGYESTPNTGITTPTLTPEPSTLALFALGAAGVLAAKRRRLSR